ncbi:MAG: hypothetical protein FWD92_05135 [Methanomassiliicoccaceae archaeon]|nr:hypothetical protein [Methanomassiliicoccaceae archaeon]
MTKDGAENLISAVSRAMKKRKLDAENFEDMLMVQKGCFILNSKGILPKYKFDVYVRGPYSHDLAEDYRDISEKDTPYETKISYECIEELSAILKKGAAFVEAYTTMEMAKNYNPKMSKDELMEFVVEIKPHLKKKIREASEFPAISPSVI